MKKMKQKTKRAPVKATAQKAKPKKSVRSKKK